MSHNPNENLVSRFGMNLIKSFISLINSVEAEQFHLIGISFFISIIIVLNGWSFELQASQTDSNKTLLTANYVQIMFITNFQAMLECFISLYELRNSSLQEVFLRPSTNSIASMLMMISLRKIGFVSKIWDQSEQDA